MATPLPTTTATTASPSPPPSPITVSPLMGTAAILSAVAWPITVVVLAVILREKLPAIGQTLFSRISKIGFAGFTLELAAAKPFNPKWSDPATNALDLRNRAKAVDINDSSARNFISQLLEFDTADYAIINIGAGEEWLTSRLYIMAIILSRVKGLKALVFTGIRTRFIGWAEPEKVRWALAKKYPHLESAYADAYSDITRKNPTNNHDAIVVTTTGRLGYESEPNNPQPSIDLLQEFLKRIERPSIPLPPSEELKTDWVLIDPQSQTYERATWLTTDKLEAILDEDLCVTSFNDETLKSKDPEEQIHLVLSTPYRWIALTTEEQKFDRLSDRNILLKQIDKQLATKT